MLGRGILGCGWTQGVSFWPFLNSSGWWWLISSVFLTRISCHKTTHGNGYYGAWPGWGVSISVLPLTEGLMLQLKLQNFGHLLEELTHWKRPWCWQRLKVGGEGDDRAWGDGLEFQQALGVGDGQGSLVCCSAWGCEELDTTGRLNCLTIPGKHPTPGVGNNTPVQYSCQENSKDRVVWRVTIHRVLGSQGVR